MQTVWTVINLPAEALPNDPLGRQPGEMLWGDDGYARDLTAHGALHRISTGAVQGPVALTEP